VRSQISVFMTGRSVWRTRAPGGVRQGRHSILDLRPGSSLPAFGDHATPCKNYE